MKWHDLLGAVLIDFFDGSPYVVETEVDLSLRKQFLDIVVIRKKKGAFSRPLPDGLSPLADHNLISFKSHQDSFDFWSILELIGHYVNYRKQMSQASVPLLPVEHFRLFAITSRFPAHLARDIPLEQSQSGVYDIQIGPLRITLLVIRNLANEPANAILKLFSIVPEQIDFACQHYRPRSDDLTGIVGNLIKLYRKEDKNMATTLEELNRKIRKEALESASVQERLRGVTASEILTVIPHEEILKALAPEERLKSLSPEELLKGLTPEERLKSLSPEEIEAYLRTLKN